MNTPMGAAFTAVKLDAIRANFPILSRKGRGGKPIAYPDTSATSQEPECVISAEADFYRRSNAAVHRGTHLLGDESTAAFEDGRTTLASFIGGHPEEIVWTKNATEAINLVALSIGHASLGRGREAVAPLRIEPGDRIVTTRAEHHANLVPWQRFCARTGAELTWLDLLPDGRIDPETLDRVNVNTKFVASTHVSNVTGAISPVAPIVERARCVGALALLDTCQSSAHMPIDVGALGVDFAVMSSHKMFGSIGIGALWGRRGLLEAMPPVLSGGSIIENVTMEGSTYMPMSERFEAGSQPVAQIAGWTAAPEYLSKLDMDRVRAQEGQLTVCLLEQIRDLEGVRVFRPSGALEHIGAIASAVEGVHPHDMGQVFDADDVAIRVGHHCAIPLHSFFGVRSSVRVSVAPMTSPEEIDRFIAFLGRTRSFFKGH